MALTLLNVPSRLHLPSSLCAQRGSRTANSRAGSLLHSSASCWLPTGKAGSRGPPDLPRPPPRGSERAHPHPKLPRFFCPRLVFSAAGTGPLPPTPLSLRSWWGSALSVCSHPLPFPPFPPSLRPRPRPSPPRPPTPEPVLSPAPRPSGRGCGRGSPAGWAPLSLRADPRARAGAPCAASRSRLPPPLLLVTSGSLPV